MLPHTSPWQPSSGLTQLTQDSEPGGRFLTQHQGATYWFEAIG